MNPLRNFYNNTHEREAVRSFMVDVLKEIAVERSFTGESVVGIKEANEMIERVFNELEQKYGKIQEPIITNSR